MAGFLYFRPQHSRPVTMHDVKAWGLGYAFENAPQGGTCAVHTPTGSVGTVFGDKARHGEGRIKMDMDAQEWQKMPRPGQQDVYVGYWKDAKPGPADLARKSQLNGYLLTMRDGKQWLCPTVRFFDKASEKLVSGLPTSVVLDDKGEFVQGDVIDEYAYLYDLLDRYATAMQAGKLVELFSGLTMASLCRDAKTLLQANYLVDAAEIWVLDLWHQSNDECTEANAIVLVGIDYNNYHEWEEISKKKTTPSPAAAVG